MDQLFKSYDLHFTRVVRSQSTFQDLVKFSQSCSGFMAGYHCINVNNTDNRFKPQVQPLIVNSSKYYPVN
jgi:hypothetical protein